MQTFKRLPIVERVFFLCPLVLLLFGGAVGALWGALAVLVNLALFQSRMTRSKKLGLSALVFILSIGLYITSAYALHAVTPQALKESLGAFFLAVGGVLIIVEFSRGLWQGKVLDPFAIFSTRVSRTLNRGRYLAAMAFWTFFTVPVLFLAFAFVFLPHG